MNDEENLTLHQKSLKALFHTPLQLLLSAKMVPVRISHMLVGNENLDVIVVCNNNILKLLLLLTAS